MLAHPDELRDRRDNAGQRSPRSQTHEKRRQRTTQKRPAASEQREQRHEKT